MLNAILEQLPGILCGAFLALPVGIIVGAIAGNDCELDPKQDWPIVQKT